MDKKQSNDTVFKIVVIIGIGIIICLQLWQTSQIGDISGMRDTSKNLESHLKTIDDDNAYIKSQITKQIEFDQQLLDTLQKATNQR